jgi:DNA-directed RNA polymerase subunit omega
MDLPQGIDSKFRFILLAAKRARQLQSGAKPSIQTHSKKVMRIAQQELAAGVVPFEVSEPPAGNNDKSRKPKSAK